MRVEHVPRSVASKGDPAGAGSSDEANHSTIPRMHRQQKPLFVTTRVRVVVLEHEDSGSHGGSGEDSEYIIWKNKKCSKPPTRLYL